jgi:hypothetical protein
VPVTVHSLGLWVVWEVALFTFELDFVQVYRKCFDLESNDAELISEDVNMEAYEEAATNLRTIVYSLAVHMIREHELQVVVDVGLALAHHAQSISVLKLQLHRVWVDDSSRDGQIVDQQMHKVFVFNPLRDFSRLLHVPVHRLRL